MGGRGRPRRLHQRTARRRDCPAAASAKRRERRRTARRLGLGSYARRWSTEDDRRLAQLTRRGDALEDVAQGLGRTPEAIRRRAARIGISSPPSAPAPRRARCSTSDQDELLRPHQALSAARLAQLLGRSDLSASRRLCLLGLRARAGRPPHHPVNHRNAAPSQSSRAARHLSRLEGSSAPLPPLSELRTQPVAWCGPGALPAGASGALTGITLQTRVPSPGLEVSWKLPPSDSTRIATDARPT
jgi:hypothetical protein